MLGRLIDQLFPTHVHEPSEEQIVHRIKKSDASLCNYSANTPWGNMLPLLHSADLRLINLETSVTTHTIKWPNKVFNYRTHPTNIQALKVAKIDYASLANNHTLDFSEEGLDDTIQALQAAGIRYTGAGLHAEDAQTPAIIPIQRSFDPGNESHAVQIFSASDHPTDWARVPTFHLIDYSQATKQRLRRLIQGYNGNVASSLKVFSVHWGPNYSWQPAKEIRDLAHFLIDECGVDIIHGHSSHHVQGIERPRPGKLIIYGCGDFIDDYALTPDYRNDLSAIWRVTVADPSMQAEKKLVVKNLEIFPTRIKNFQTHLLETKDPDHEWVLSKVATLSHDLGYDGLISKGEANQLMFEV